MKRSRSQTANILSKAEFYRKKDNDNKRKHKMSKLYSSVTNFILNASSKDGEFAATSVSKSCASFFGQESAGLTDRELSVLYYKLWVSLT
jgi:hypothetical protein